MPIYEFLCKKCDHVFSVLQGLNESIQHRCPKCNGNGLKRLISVVRTRLGKDFYEEEYKRGEFID